MKNTVLVTGGSGYIGSWVVKGLIEKGYTVRMTVRDKSKKEKYEFLTNIANKYKLPKSNNPKWVLSLIGSFFGLSRKFVKTNVGIPIQFDTSKSVEKLKLKYTPLQQTVRDMADQMESQ